MDRKTHTIDATGKVLGRLAVEVAGLLRGKQKPTFAPHKDEGDFVNVINADKIKITGNKIENKKYYRYTGYLGGLRVKTLKNMFVQEPGEVLKRAVFGMLAKNKLRARQIKRLKVK